MPKYTPVSFEINLRPEGFVFAVGSLIAALMGRFIGTCRDTPRYRGCEM
jgi:hypothetical protein